MLNLNPHIFRCGPNESYVLTEDEVAEPTKFRKHIEPWLTAVFQSEHISLLLGSGFTCGVANACDGKPADMSKCTWNCELKEQVDKYAESTAISCQRGSANIEDQIRAAIQLKSGLEVIGDERALLWDGQINMQFKQYLDAILASEQSIREAAAEKKQLGEGLLVSFLLSFASRAATRDRMNLFTTNCDRLVEHGCDLAGLHVIDRFVGSLSPVFRASRLNIDIHYNPPGIRGEPRYLEGVIRLCKLHGSLDWRWEKGELRRCALPFGAGADHPAIPEKPTDSVLIYPNPAKDVETLDYPYAELFRDFASAICRPNSSLVVYGYGFGDDHVNRIIADMLTIPSTHLAIIAWDKTNPDNNDDPSNASRKRIIRFCSKVGKPSQISLLLGSCFGDLTTLVNYYLPKPAIDQITIRRAEILQQRREPDGPTSADDQAAK